jgi:hypothetical protein
MPELSGFVGYAGARLSPIELLLPDGAAGHMLLLGSSCPHLLGRIADANDGVAADLIILAPTELECRQPGWLEQMADRSAQSIAPDGLVYLLAPRRWRSRLAALLQRRGLLVTLRVVHLPDHATSRYLVPLAVRPARFAFTSLLPTRRAPRALALLALRLPFGARLLTTALPAVGLVARRPGAPPLFGWMSHDRQALRQGDSAVIAMSGPGKASAVLHHFADRKPTPSAVVKVALAHSAASSIVTEGALIKRLGGDAARAGAQVPRVRLAVLANEHPALFQTVLRGRPLALLLAEDPRRLPAAIESVAGWLERWASLSQHSRQLHPTWLQRHVLAPLDQIEPQVGAYAPYRAWLQECCAELAGTGQTCVAAHNDLTMWNVLQGEHGGLGIVDWEAGQSSFFPLTDLLYAAVDAVAASNGYADRLAAFQACFVAGGARSAPIAAYRARIGQALGIGSAWARLCFHACWLHHAANEQRTRPEGQLGPFGQITAWMACHHDRLLEVY